MQDEPFYMDFSFFKNIRVNSRVNFQMRVEMFNATKRGAVGESQHHRDQHGLRVDHGEPGQRSAVGAAAVPDQLLNDRVRLEGRDFRCVASGFSGRMCRACESVRQPPPSA